MAKKSREKGKRGERAAAKELAMLFPGAKRNHSQADGADDSDVRGVPLWVEVKVGKAPPIQAAMEQARRDTDGRPPVVMSKKDRGEWLITMPLNVFRGLFPQALPDNDGWAEFLD